MTFVKQRENKKVRAEIREKRYIYKLGGLIIE